VTAARHLLHPVTGLTCGATPVTFLACLDYAKGFDQQAGEDLARAVVPR
jgi:hypothetical protein